VTAPDFSVVVPTYRRPDALRRCLAALGGLDRRGPSFEVLVADDGEGGTEAIARSVEAAALGGRLRLLALPHAGPAAARNAGARAATGRWVAFTDDDCEPRPGWLAGFAAGFAAHPSAALGGRTVNRLDRSLLAEAHHLLVEFCSRAALARDRSSRFFPSNNLALRRDAFLALGGFDESFPFAAGEDRDLSARWLASGGELLEAPEAEIDHGHAFGLAGWIRMHARYGRGARRFRRLRAERSGGEIHLEPLRFYLGLLRSPFAAPRARRPARLSAGLLVAQLAHAAGYLREWAAEGRAAAPARTGGALGRRAQGSGS
jgi:GT2 family glycosyltransferase